MLGAVPSPASGHTHPGQQLAFIELYEHLNAAYAVVRARACDLAFRNVFISVNRADTGRACIFISCI